MSYSSRTRYKTRREKNRNAFLNVKRIILFLLLALVVYCIKNRISIRDYIMTYFY